MKVCERRREDELLDDLRSRKYEVRADVRDRALPEASRGLYGDAPIDAISLYETPIDGGLMGVVTISPKFQVVIPREIRERLKLEPGQKVQAIAYDDRIEFIPVRSLRSMRGFLKGIDPTVRRDRDRV